MQTTDLGRYTLIRKIASGGMATVYVGYDKTLSREVAVKIIHPHLMDDVQIIKRFENEANAIASLSHENVVKIYDYGQIDKCRFIVMELIEGITLQELIDTHKNLPNSILLYIFNQIFSGIEAAHVKNIIHRDIKPANIMIDRNGLIRIMDFGIAHLMQDESLTMTGTFLGSPNYLSPEQASGKKVCPKSDIFSCGTLMYECATGKNPFERDTIHASLLSIINDVPSHVQIESPLILDEIAELIDNCLCKEIGKRFESNKCALKCKEIQETYKWTLNSNHFKNFVDTPENFRSKENDFLYEYFCTLALKNRKIYPVIALRYFSKASHFKELSKGQLKEIASIKKMQQAKRITPVLLSVVCLSIVIVTLVNFYPKIFNNQKNSKPTIVNRIEKLSINNKQVSGYPQDTVNKKDTILQNTKTIDLPQSKELKSKITKVNVSKIPSALPELKNSNTSSNLVNNSKGILRIHTNPPWSMVSINGIPVGTTPISVPLSLGNHLLKITKDGCKAYEEQIQITKVDTLLKEIILERLIE